MENTKQTTKQVKDMNLNPTGKGGFGDNPQNINPGGRPKNVQRYAYWLQVFKDMTVEEFEAYDKEHPVSKRYKAEDQAYKWMVESDEHGRSRTEIADRTEGKPAQSIDHTSNGETLKGAIFAFEDNPEPED